MTPYYFELPEHHLVISNASTNGWGMLTRKTLNETVRHALRECKLQYVKKWHAIKISSEIDEANLVIFKLRYL